MQPCTLCPRKCGADRTKTAGFCGAKSKIKIARAALHMWEEPCISGTHAGLSFICGKLGDKDVCLTTCGIGKVNAALCTQNMINLCEVDAIINTGVAGGIREDVSPGELVIATDLVEHDMDTTHFGDPLGQVPGMDVLAFPCDKALISHAKEAALNMDITAYAGRIVSGDQFIASREKADFLYEQFGAYACEMEGAAICHVCYVNRIPVVVIRAISDNARSGATIEYHTFIDRAASMSANLVLSLIQKAEY